MKKLSKVTCQEVNLELIKIKDFYVSWSLVLSASHNKHGASNIVQLIDLEL